MLTVIAGALCLWAAPARAGNWISADYGQVRLIGSGLDAGIDVRLAPGWHAYWRMPGDGGLAPTMDWTGSTNLKGATVEWILPQRFSDAGLQSFGYNNNYILPVRITPEDPAKPVDLKLQMSMMVCEQICVPQTFNVELALPVTDSADAVRLQTARKAIPVQGDVEQLKIDNVVVGPDAVVAHVFAPRGFDQFDMFVESGDVYVTAVPEVTLDESDPHYAMIRVAAPQGVDNLFNEITGQGVTLTVTDGVEAIERHFDF